MREAKLISTGEVPIVEIDATDRLRPVSEASIDSLMASIRQLGRMKDEIHVRKVRHQGGKLKLIAGGHRLAAAKRLGWDTIEAKIWDCSDDWATLLEIDDNLASAELSPLELATFLAERKRVYEKLHPETKRGVAGSAARWNATELSSFASSTAEKRGITERQVRKIVAAGAGLSRSEVATLHSATQTITLEDLLVIAKVGEPDERTSLIKRLVSGKFKNAAAAWKAIKGGVKPHPDPVEEHLKKLLTVWHRAPKTTKRRFVRNQIELLTRLIADEGQGDTE